MNDNFQEIATALQSVLPVGWKKVCVYAEFGDTYHEIAYYCFVDGKPESIQCYDLPTIYQIEESQIDNAISEIARAFNRERTSTKDKWSVATYVLTSDGKFKLDFDYVDLTEGSYEYKKIWKVKYLLL